MEVSKPPPGPSAKLSRKASVESSLSTSFHNLNISSGSSSLNYSSSKVTPKARSRTPNGHRLKLDKSGLRQSRTPSCDRFFADRSTFELSNYLMTSDSFSNSATTDGGENTETLKKELGNYTKALNEAVLGISDLKGTRILSFAQKPKGAPEGYQNAQKIVYQGANVDFLGNKYRVLPKSPERVLDAPDVVDDYYLNVLDWSTTNMVAIALRDQVYLWKAHTAEIIRLPCDVQQDVSMITAVKWVRDGSHVLCATDAGTVQVWDVAKTKLIRTLRTVDTNMRIAAMSVQSHTVIEGNRLGVLRQHDLRVPEHLIHTIKTAHAQEICGVEFSLDGRFVATGANDNVVNIWDVLTMSSSANPVTRFTQHIAAVKALCWSPTHNSVIASGGGTNDRTIKVWNVSSGNLLKSIDAESQVSGLIWSEAYREIISAHGFSKNHLAVWKYPQMELVGEILGHQHRVLKMALSPDQTTVATVSGDETLRFWRVFPPTRATRDKAKVKSQSVLNLQSLR